MTQLNYINKPIFDHGAIEQISEVLRGMGIKRPLICTDPGLVQLGMLDQARNLISNEFTPIVFDYPSYVPRDYIARGISYSTEKPEGYTVDTPGYVPREYKRGYTPNYFDTAPLIMNPFTNAAQQSSYKPLSMAAILSSLLGGR